MSWKFCQIVLLKKYLWTLEALDTAFLLALSMPAWMEAIIFPSGPFKMSSTVVISGRPWDWHQSMAVGVNLLVGVSSSIWQKREKLITSNICSFVFDRELALSVLYVCFRVLVVVVVLLLLSFLNFQSHIGNIFLFLIGIFSFF